MQVIRKDISFPVDIDDTLIKRIFPDDPRWNDAMVLDYYGEERRAVPLKGNISILKASVARGRNVVVWSGNGFAWAEQVLNKLALDSLDVYVMSKPAGYLDNEECTLWMGAKVFDPSAE